jgi:hypothetical protein
MSLNAVALDKKSANNRYTVKLKTGDLHIYSNSTDFELSQLIGFAGRYNEKRHFLFASKVLGKYIPAKPSDITQAQKKLVNISTFNKKGDTLFMGFAESATGLGESIYRLALNEGEVSNRSLYTHSTRQFDSKGDIAINFEETHSHAVDQVIYYPTQTSHKDIFLNADNLVLIEDEITTGNTMMNLINAYLSLNANIKTITILALVDWRSKQQIESFNKVFSKFKINTYSLISGTISFEQKHPNLSLATTNGRDNPKTSNKTSAKYGIGDKPLSIQKAILKANNELNGINKVLIVGTSEFTYWSYNIAKCLEDSGIDVLLSATTRAPLKVGLDIKTKLSFSDHYGEGLEHFIYNAPSDRKIFICYENHEQCNEHSELLMLLNATPLILSEEL